MAEPIRDATRQAYLGRIDAILEKRNDIAALSLEELHKLARFPVSAGNGCCNGLTGLAPEEPTI